MQYRDKRFSKPAQLRFSLFVILCLSVFTACGMKDVSGGYIGEAKVELKPYGYSPTGSLTDSNHDVLAVLTQDGDTVTLKLGNTVLLGNCELKARFTKRTAYITDGPICDVNIAGTRRTVNIVGGNISVGDYGDADVSIRVDGFVGSRETGDSFILNFKGKSKK